MWVDRLSWAAGIFDTCVRVVVKTSKALPIGAEIVATFDDVSVRTAFVDVVGGRIVGRRQWRLDAHQQLEALRKVVPYMQNPLKVHKCNQVIAFRFVQGQGDKKRKIMNDYRKGLIGEAMRSFQERLLQLPLDRDGAVK